MLYVFGAVATFVAMFGSEGRGSWSGKIAMVGGILWLTSNVLAFYQLGFKEGSLFLLGTFIFAAILQKILRPFLNPHGH
jgi:hypothetical protein